MDNDRPDRLERVRLPGFEERVAAGRHTHTWHAQPSWQPPYPPRDYGARHTRRVSNWTAAALVAGVAATTGYLAHAIPATGAKSGTSKPKAHTSAPAVVPVQPAVQAPVVTSGGSAGRGGGGD